MAGIPVVSIVGKSDSGKTTVVEQLVRRLVDRGHRVATCKHHVHEVDIDVPGKDSWRHARAGAQVTMISAPTQFAVVSKVERERTLEEIVAAAGDVDILITEGFKRSGSVRIEVSRRARSDELVSAPEQLTALITDNNDLQPEGVSRFELNDYDALTDFVERSFLDGGSPHGD